MAFYKLFLVQTALKETKLKERKINPYADHYDKSATHTCSSFAPVLPTCPQFSLGRRSLYRHTGSVFWVYRAPSLCFSVAVRFPETSISECL